MSVAHHAPERVTRHRDLWVQTGSAFIRNIYTRHRVCHGTPCSKMFAPDTGCAPCSRAVFMAAGVSIFIANGGVIALSSSATAPATTGDATLQTHTTGLIFAYPSTNTIRSPLLLPIHTTYVLNQAQWLAQSMLWSARAGYLTPWPHSMQHGETRTLFLIARCRHPRGHARSTAGWAQQCPA